MNLKQLLNESDLQLNRLLKGGEGSGGTKGEGTRGGNIYTDYNRNTLSRNICDVKTKLKEYNIDFKELNQHAWGWKGSGIISQHVEFHINENKYLPKGFYWSGKGESRTDAKAKGWAAFLDGLESGTIKLVKPK